MVRSRPKCNLYLSEFNHFARIQVVVFSPNWLPLCPNTTVTILPKYNCTLTEYNHLVAQIGQPLVAFKYNSGCMRAKCNRFARKTTTICPNKATCSLNTRLVVFAQIEPLCPNTTAFIRKKQPVLGQNGCIRTKVTEYGQAGCNPTTTGCIRANCTHFSPNTTTVLEQRNTTLPRIRCTFAQKCSHFQPNRLYFFPNCSFTFPKYNHCIPEYNHLYPGKLVVLCPKLVVLRPKYNHFVRKVHCTLPE